MNDPLSSKDGVQSLLNKWRHGKIAYYVPFSQIAGGVVPGVFLSQLYYWSGKGWYSDGWFYKSVREWTLETGLTEAEQKTARSKLLAAGFIEIRNAGRHNIRNYRLNYDAIFEALQSLPDSPCL